MKKYILIFCAQLIFLSHLGFAQSGGKIVGTVTDGSNGQPLIGCSIFIENLMLGDATDENGNYLILNIPAGNYNVKAQMIGFNTQMIENVRVSSGLTITLNYALITGTIEMPAVTVTSYKIPPVQKDLTSKLQGRTGEEISQIPITTVKDVLVQQAGVTKQIFN